MAKLIGYRSMVFAPMLWNERGIGAIGVARSTGPFKPKELAMLQTFADQAVIAIQNARLFNETKEALETQTATADVLRVISQSPDDVQPVFDAIAERAKLLCDGMVSAVSRFDGQLVHLVAYDGVSPQVDAQVRARFPMRPSNESISGRAVLARGPVQIEDIEAEAGYAPQLPRPRARPATAATCRCRCSRTAMWSARSSSAGPSRALPGQRRSSCCRPLPTRR